MTSSKIFLLILTLLNTVFAAGRKLEIIPGQSLGPYKIGSTVSQLKSQGFTKDPDRSLDYYIKDNFIVLTENGQITQIWYTGKTSDLSYKKKNLPMESSITNLQNIFKNCDEPQTGSAGVIMYCHNKGISITTSSEPSQKNKYEISVIKAPISK